MAIKSSTFVGDTFPEVHKDIVSFVKRTEEQLISYEEIKSLSHTITCHDTIKVFSGSCIIVIGKKI